jgi:ribonuclease Z
MKPIFHPRLINGQQGDPALYLGFLYERRAILFDCGELYALPARQLIKISHIFISHTHMDHFIGFDHLLRLLLGRDKILTIFGPSGIIAGLEHKLAAYSWNLVQNYTNHFEIRVYEVDSEKIIKASFICRQGFRQNTLPDEQPFTGLLLEEKAFTVSAAILDHLLPSLAFCFEEKFHLNINQVRLYELGLAPGSWLRELKEWVWDERDERDIFNVQYEIDGKKISKAFPFGVLQQELVSRSRGQKVAYVADAAYSPANVQKIKQLAAAADYFFCEAAFMDDDREQARRTYHLTAEQAGRLAKEANVQRFTPFHFSPRYSDKLAYIEHEARAAFGGHK